MKKAIIFISFFVTILDQVIKYFVVNTLEVYKSVKVINNFFYITYVRNDGAAFSILKGSRIIFIIIAILALIILIKSILMDKKICKYDVLTYSLVISGILGNLIDRIYYGVVIDYLDFYILGYNMPIFNLADSLIVVGAILIIYKMIKGDKNEDFDGNRGIK